MQRPTKITSDSQAGRAWLCLEPIVISSLRLTPRAADERYRGTAIHCLIRHPSVLLVRPVPRLVRGAFARAWALEESAVEHWCRPGRPSPDGD